MPIDITVNVDELKARRYPLILLSVLILCVLAGFVFLGRSLTPAGEKLLTWSEWQIFQARRAYNNELQGLRRDVEELAALVNEPADPVRAQIVCKRIISHTLDGQASLAYCRESVADAAAAVEQWAVGVESLDHALTALEFAVQVLEQLEPDMQGTP
ncbi:hypothetical protein EG834_17190 [bacterium]|nr:hypothetical protein [bacterium]